MRVCTDCNRDENKVKFFQKRGLCVECYNKRQRDNNQNKSLEEKKSRFDIKKGGFNHIRIHQDNYYTWDFELAVDTCRDLENPFEWVTAVYFCGSWYEVQRTVDFCRAKDLHIDVYRGLKENNDSVKKIRKYLTFDLKVL